MLQRSLSPPANSLGHCETGTAADSEQDMPACPPQVRRHLGEDDAAKCRWAVGSEEEARLWEDEGGLLVSPPACSQQSNGTGVRWRAMYCSTEQLRSLADEGDVCRHEEVRVPDEALTDDQLSPNSYDLSTEGESNVVANLVHAKNCLKRMNAELQETVDLTEDSNAVLRSENSMLRNQVKGMKEAVDSAKQLMEELEETRGSLTEQAKVKAKLETSVKQLEKENEILKYQVEALTNEMSNTSERQIDKEKIIHLSSLLLELQQDMEETRLTLAHKEEVIEKKDFQIEQLESSQAEYSLIVQDLKEKLKDLEDQLAEALISAGEGSFQNLDGTFSPTPQRSISLCEELKLVQDVTVQELYEETEVVEVVRCPSLPKLSWWQKTQSGLKRRARAAGALSFCLLLPLCVVTTIAPCYYDNAELTCEEILWNAAHRLVQKCFHFHYIGLPAI